MKITDETKKTKAKRKTKEQKEKLISVFIPFILERIKKNK